MTLTRVGARGFTVVVGKGCRLHQYLVKIRNPEPHTAARLSCSAQPIVCLRKAPVFLSPLRPLPSRPVAPPHAIKARRFGLCSQRWQLPREFQPHRYHLMPASCHCRRPPKTLVKRDVSVFARVAPWEISALLQTMQRLHVCEAFAS